MSRYTAAWIAGGVAFVAVSVVAAVTNDLAFAGPIALLFVLLVAFGVAVRTVTRRKARRGEDAVGAPGPGLDDQTALGDTPEHSDVPSPPPERRAGVH